ncbi:MAG TPA: aquaporin [Gemmatimonadales bacterium]|nr:aquaporin [Gemmatimonadales bacterium]
MVPLSRRLVAEFLGTFALIFIGCGSVIADSYARFGLLGIALAHALVLGVMVTALMNISGGHFNPAVTTGLLVGRRIDARTAGAYIVTQLVGGVAGALALKLVLPVAIEKVTSLGLPTLAPGMGFGQAVALEAILTFFLVSAVYGTAVAKNAPKVGGFAIGLVLLFDILMGGALTGAAMNPARAFGPAAVAGVWSAHAVWWIGPLVGGVVAGLLWDRVLLKGE